MLEVELLMIVGCDRVVVVTGGYGWRARDEKVASALIVGGSRFGVSGELKVPYIPRTKV